jgi:hypothetical protein
MDNASFYQWDHRSFTVCSGVRDVKLRDVRNYIPFAPYGQHVLSWERGFKDFSPTEAIPCYRSAFVIPWTAGTNSFSGVHESGLSWRARRLPKGTPWLLVNNAASIFCAVYFASIFCASIGKIGLTTHTPTRMHASGTNEPLALRCVANQSKGWFFDSCNYGEAHRLTEHKPISGWRFGG